MTRLGELEPDEQTALWAVCYGVAPSTDGSWPGEAFRALWARGYMTMIAGGRIVLTAAGERIVGGNPRPALMVSNG